MKRHPSQKGCLIFLCQNRKQQIPERLYLINEQRFVWRMVFYRCGLNTDDIHIRKLSEKNIRLNTGMQMQAFDILTKKSSMLPGKTILHHPIVASRPCRIFILDDQLKAKHTQQFFRAAMPKGTYRSINAANRIEGVQLPCLQGKTGKRCGCNNNVSIVRIALSYTCVQEKHCPNDIGSVLR